MKLILYHNKQFLDDNRWDFSKLIMERISKWGFELFSDNLALWQQIGKSRIPNVEKG